jgi:hypothetical protein
MRSYVALGCVAVAAIAAVVVACSDSGNNCKPGTLALTIELTGTANFADTITISARDPAINQTVMHHAGDTDLVHVDVTFPNGYPADKLLTLYVRATGGITLLGENVANIHLLPGCSTGGVVINSGYTVDAFVPSD